MMISQMFVQTKLQNKLLEFQSLNPNQINHQDPIDFQALINSTSSSHKAYC
jgi:hypothetical protein